MKTTEQIIEENGVEFQPESNYSTICPQCSHNRDKSDQKCLKVYIEDEAVIFQCFHSGCIWNERQVNYMKQSKFTVRVKEKSFIPWNDKGTWDPDIKEYFDTATKYPYYNKDEQLIFYILRHDNAEGKDIKPISLGSDGKYQLTRPTGIMMPYRIEHFDPSKPTLIVEGEKAADYAAKIAQSSNVLSWVGGAGNIKNTDWSMLAGNEITLWPDHDEEGEKAIDILTNDILLSMPVLPSKIYRINTEKLPPKYDVADIADLSLLKELFKEKIEVKLDLLSEHQYTVDRLLEEFNKKEDYIPFGWKNVDSYVQIPEPGLTVFTARTNHGKTNSMINLACNILQNTDKTVVYVSYEENGKKVGKRFLKTLDPENREMNHMDYDRFLTNGYFNGEVKFINEFKEKLFNNQLRLYDVKTPLTVIISQLNRLKALGKPTVAILDYAQRLPSISNNQRYLAIKEQMEELVNLANTNGQAIITGAQVTMNKENSYADMARESRDIENSADLVISVWNKSVGNANGAKAYEDVEGDIIWTIKKARQDKAIGKNFGFTSNNGCDLKPTCNFEKSMLDLKNRSEF